MKPKRDSELKNIPLPFSHEKKSQKINLDSHYCLKEDATSD